MTKSESARLNGAKSRGPVTEAGRRRSSQNALKHGLSAQTILLPSEDPDEFHQLLDSYVQQFQPDGPVELDLIQDMVAAKWRLQRLALIETQLFIESIEHVEQNHDDFSPIESLTSAFERIVQDNSLAFLNRAESRLERTYSRALRNLIQLQKLRQPTDPPSAPPPGENKICKNEPTEPVQPNGHFTLRPATPPPSTTPAEPPHLDLTPQLCAPATPLATILNYVPRSRAHRHSFA